METDPLLLAAPLDDIKNFVRRIICWSIAILKNHEICGASKNLDVYSIYNYVATEHYVEAHSVRRMLLC